VRSWCLQRRVRSGASLRLILAAGCPSSPRTQRQFGCRCFSPCAGNLLRSAPRGASPVALS
jgi:hypothetical protein